MTGRERILSAINHKEPDRVPLDLGSTTSSGISAIAYNNLKNCLNIDEGHTKVYDVVQQVAEPEEKILNLLGIDVVALGRTFNTDNSKWYPVTLSNGSTGLYPKWFLPKFEENSQEWQAFKGNELLAKMPKGTTYFDQCVYPYENGYPQNYTSLSQDMDRVLWSAFAHSPWDHANETGFWKELRQNAITLRERTDRAIMVTCGCNLFEWGCYLRRMDNFLMDIYTDPKNVEALLDALMELHMKTLAKVCEYVGDIVDIVRFCDDLGMDQSPFISPEKYEKIFKPKHQQLFTYTHKHSNMKTFLHSCGSIYKVLPHLIDAGLDIINPIQTTAVDMEPAKLKKEFGKDITFWGGGCNTRSILNRGTPSEIREYVLRMLEIFAPGGGYVFNQEHNIMPDVPPENLLAMYNAVKEFNGIEIIKY